MSPSHVRCPQLNINCATDVTIYANVSTLRNNTKPVFTTAKYNFNLTGDALLKYNISCI